MTEPYEPAAPATAPGGSLLARRLRDLGLLAAILGAVGLGYLQFLAGTPERLETLEAVVVAGEAHRGTTPIGIVRRTLPMTVGETRVDVQVPADFAAEPGTRLPVERLTLPDGRVEYRLSPKVKTGR